MIEYKVLQLPEYNKYYGRISEMNVMVLEDLYYYLTGYNAPYEPYAADNIVSPRDIQNHNEYFRIVKPAAINLFERWYPLLIDKVVKNASDLKSIDTIGYNIKQAKDMVELIWYSQLLLSAVHQYPINLQVS